MSNSTLVAVTLLVLAAHLAALAGAVLARRGAGAVLALNLVAGGAVLLFLATHPRWMAPPVDWQAGALAGFEAAVICAAIAGLRQVRFAGVASWVFFAVHLLASAGAVLFALTFRITRLF